MSKDEALKVAKQIFLPAGYDTIFTKYRLIFFIVGIILLFMGISSSTYFWIGVICLILSAAMVIGSLLARKSMAQRLSQNR